MALDPRSNLTARCPATKQLLQGKSSAAKDFFSAAKKVGDLEILNDVGFGKVAEGLRNLASVSDTVRTSGAVPSALLNEANDTNNVLSAVSIDPNIVSQVASFHPEVANRALGQAKSIARRVAQGGFELNDIPGAFADLQNLKTLGEGIFPGESGTGVRRRNELIERCDPSPYAQDLISYYPKYKFLFVVEFKYTEAFKNLDFINHAFVVKNTTRPNIEFEYDEVNMYNFWTRVIKRTMFQPMTMRFYDDSWNQAMQFYNSYLQSMSPITNLDFQQGSEVTRELEESGMKFNPLGTGATPKQGGASGAATTHRYAASVGPLANSATTKTILSRINLYHVYREGARMNVYQFINPKITNLELDELDMADNGNGNEVSLQFAYDTVNILTNVDTIKDSRFRIEDVSSGSIPGAQVLYPLAPIPGLDPDETRKNLNTAVSEDEYGPGNSPLAAADQTVQGADEDPLDAFGGAGPSEATSEGSEDPLAGPITAAGSEEAAVTEGAAASSPEPGTGAEATRARSVPATAPNLEQAAKESELQANFASQNAVQHERQLAFRQDTQARNDRALQQAIDDGDTEEIIRRQERAVKIDSAIGRSEASITKARTAETALRDDATQLRQRASQTTSTQKSTQQTTSKGQTKSDVVLIDRVDQQKNLEAGAGITFAK